MILSNFEKPLWRWWTSFFTTGLTTCSNFVSVSDCMRCRIIQTCPPLLNCSQQKQGLSSETVQLLYNVQDRIFLGTTHFCQIQTGEISLYAAAIQLRPKSDSSFPRSRMNANKLGRDFWNELTFDDCIRVAVSSQLSYLWIPSEVWMVWYEPFPCCSVQAVRYHEWFDVSTAPKTLNGDVGYVVPVTEVNLEPEGKGQGRSGIQCLIGFLSPFGALDHTLDWCHVFPEAQPRPKMLVIFKNSKKVWVQTLFTLIARENKMSPTVFFSASCEAQCVKLALVLIKFIEKFIQTNSVATYSLHAQNICWIKPNF